MRNTICIRRALNAAVIALLILCPVCLPMRGSADDSAGVVGGYVRDEYNRPLQGATLTLRSGDVPDSFRTTDRSGYFTFLAVLPGTYFVIAAQKDYEVCYTHFAIYPNQTKSLHFRLPIAIKTIGRIVTPYYCRTYEPIWAISY